MMHASRTPRLWPALPILASLALITPCTTHATSQTRTVDPMAPVYIVSSEQTYRHGVRTLARAATQRTHKTGQRLMISELRAHQLSTVARHIHAKEHRCGGFFSFSTWHEADAFVRSDRSASTEHIRFLANYTIDNGRTVTPWLDQVSQDRLYDTIQTLSSHTNRYYASVHGKDAAQQVATSWKTLTAHRTDVIVQTHACTGCGQQGNVILTIPGTELADEVVVLGGHLDSINSDANDDPNQRAPGADDNASGIAALTEIIRISTSGTWRPKRTIKFIAYAAEEVGLRGSSAIAEDFKHNGINVVGSFNFDMINYRVAGAPDINLVSDYSNAALQDFVKRLFNTYLQPKGLRLGTIKCHYACTDHAAWTAVGYPALTVHESGQEMAPNWDVHTERDTLATLDNTAAPSVKFAQLGLAYLGELGKTGQ